MVRWDRRWKRNKKTDSSSAALSPTSQGAQSEMSGASSSAYQPPPPTPTRDSLDKIVGKVDEQGTDKYHTMISEQPSNVMMGASSSKLGVSYFSEATTNVLSEITAGTATSYEQEEETEYDEQSRKAQRSLATSAASSSAVPFNVTSASTGMYSETPHDNKSLLLLESSADYYHTKQQYAYCSLCISAIHVLILMMQLALCGVAPLDVNPMVGPYPDAFSEWGGKNAYWIQQGHQYWRFVTPCLLHVGVLHLLCNAVVQLETCAFFEREWGSIKWLFLYVLSEVGCIVASCVANPDTVAVGSSGALMGLFGAKLAQVVSYTCFDIETRPHEESIRLEHLSNMLCSLAVISLMSFITYIDFSGHMGGLGTGFCAGMCLFSSKIKSTCTKILWGGLGLLTVVGGLAAGVFLLYVDVETDEEMANACEYFRNLFVEDYDCDCFWE